MIFGVVIICFQWLGIFPGCLYLLELGKSVFILLWIFIKVTYLLTNGGDYCDVGTYIFKFRNVYLRHWHPFTCRGQHWHWLHGRFLSRRYPKYIRYSIDQFRFCWPNYILTWCFYHCWFSMKIRLKVLIKALSGYTSTRSKRVFCL